MRRAILPRFPAISRSLSGSQSQPLPARSRLLGPHIRALANVGSAATTPVSLPRPQIQWSPWAVHDIGLRNGKPIFGMFGVNRAQERYRCLNARHVLLLQSLSAANIGGVSRRLASQRPLQPRRRLFSTHGALQRQYVYRTFPNGERRVPHAQNQRERQSDGLHDKKRESKAWMLYCVAFGVGFYMWNVDTVPMTGRRRFNMVSDNVEAVFGRWELNSTLREHRNRILPPKHPWSIHVRHVMSRILAAHQDEPDMQGVDWEVFVIDAPNEFNAFVLPGGKVFVFTGILRACKDEEGLATVLGHEIAHVRAHHLAEKMSQNSLTLIGACLAFIFIGILGAGYIQFNQLETVLPHSRTQEEEADRIGLLMLAKSCYEPAAAPELWRRLDAAEQIKVPEILSTHPTSQKRMENLIKWQAEAEKVYKERNCGPTFRHYRNFSDFWRYF